jgi:hypothetical protein
MMPTDPAVDDTSHIVAAIEAVHDRDACEHADAPVALPMLTRRWDQIREPVEKLKP